MTIIEKQENDSDAGSISDHSESQNESGSEADMQEFDMPSIVNHFFTNEEGENIASILSGIKKSLDVHNKLIYKLLSVSKENK